MPRENPFVPVPGRTPSDLIGRDEIIGHFASALAQKNSPYRLMRVSGIRGMGKTALLARLRRMAREANWFVYDDEVRPTSDWALAQELKEATTRSWRQRIAGTTVDVSPLHIKTATDTSNQDQARELRFALQEFMEKKNKLGFLGLAILLDEVQDADIDALRRIATAVQRVTDDHPDIVFVFAGLPSMIGSVVDAPSLTFLRRAMPEVLGELVTSEVMASMGATIASSGLTIDAKALVLLSEATNGYPYLIQLAGYFAWEAATARDTSDTPRIELEDVKAAIAIANRRFEETVIEPVLARLNDRCLSYLFAMARLGMVASTSEIAKALDTHQKALSTTRAKLLREQVIESPKRGYVAFSIPGMQTYLMAHRGDLAR